jgi:hypothetical protein
VTFWVQMLTPALGGSAANSGARPSANKRATHWARVGDAGERMIVLLAQGQIGHELESKSCAQTNGAVLMMGMAKAESQGARPT